MPYRALSTSQRARRCPQAASRPTSSSAFKQQESYPKKN
ncbi:predicted protein [Botrytis cinerea T4]|uniref:Uncharacterized protein n=1 Tax=Botryotinia fuckeliana (strain T4) TaxID=999810 RepID=G2YI82_BOTF4|nr:predicted protein [Botrytis cinerea T4]